MGKNKKIPKISQKEYEKYYYKRSSLKYSKNEIPEDYINDTEVMMYDVFYCIDEERMDINEAYNHIEQFYKLKKDFLKELLLKNKYIREKNNKKDIDREIKKINTKNLKKLLKKHDLKTSGKREKIEQRILKNIPEEIIKSEFTITSKGKYFYTYHKRRVRLYNEYLIENYYFSEFNEYYKKNYRKCEKNLLFDFIKLHNKKALERQDHQSYIDSCDTKASVYEFICVDYENALKEELKSFIMNVNPIWLDNKYYKYHNPINQGTAKNLYELKKELGKDYVLSKFIKVWEDFDFKKIIVPKNTAYKYLKELLKRKEIYSKLNDDLCEKYFKNENLKIKYIKQSNLDDYF